MKKTLKLIAAALVIVAGACSKESAHTEKQVSELVPVTLSVYPESPSTHSSKSYLGEDGRRVLWSEGDGIKILETITNGAQDTPLLIDINTGTVTFNLPSEVASFYGVFPFHQQTRLAEANKIETNFSAVQFAVPGNIPRKANLAIGYSRREDLKMNFKNIGAIISFTLDYDNIISVSFSGNNNEIVAGKTLISHQGEMNYSASLAREGSETIILKNQDGSPLAKGVRYYMVVFPQTYSNGIRLTLATSNGKVASKSSTTGTTISRNANLNLGIISGLDFNKDLYTFYQAGNDLTIAGKVYNKAVNGNASLLNSNDNPNLYDSVSGKKGLFFLKGSASFTNSKTLILNQDIIIASNNPEEPATYAPDHNWSIRKGSIVLSDIKINLNGIENHLSNNINSLTEDFEAIVFDKCSFSNIKKPLLYASNNAAFGTSTISVTNCKIQLASGTSLFNAHSCTSMHKYKNIVFENNIMYSSNTVNAQVFNYNNSVAQDPAETWNGSISMKNNIFYNISSTNGLIRQYKVNSLAIGGNIYYVTTPENKVNKSYYLFSPDQDKSVINNTGDKLNGGGKWVYSGNPNGHANGIANLLTNESGNIFSSFDIATGSYVLNAGYENFGPQGL